jgi:hypothetical protein
MGIPKTPSRAKTAPKLRLRFRMPVEDETDKSGPYHSGDRGSWTIPSSSGTWPIGAGSRLYRLSMRLLPILGTGIEAARSNQPTRTTDNGDKGDNVPIIGLDYFRTFYYIYLNDRIWICNTKGIRWERASTWRISE